MPRLIVITIRTEICIVVRSGSQPVNNRFKTRDTRLIINRFGCIIRIQIADSNGINNQFIRTDQITLPDNRGGCRTWDNTRYFRIRTPRLRIDTHIVQYDTTSHVLARFKCQLEGSSLSLRSHEANCDRSPSGSSIVVATKLHPIRRRGETIVHD